MPDGIHALASDDQDRALVDRVRHGDMAAFETLVGKYVGPLSRYVATTIGVREAADDVVQDIFVSFWRRRESLQIVGNVKGYLYRAARNAALNVARHDAAERRAAGVWGSEKGDVVLNEGAAQIEGDELQQVVQRALMELPPRAREIFLMHRVDGLSYAEIADALGVGIPTIYVQMSRAAKQLARAVQDWQR